ncbi:hypothetical protein NP233_g7910 [Leucocoprinus birnbaumii]|uniref:U4/U6 snRNA-associated-splicing factor PRP24 n=1 Tax=Leucocoprinus birnbaumii TaxID=56174 RepID=A0AAD5VN87_9AGAR|nr:hypothetical protein NP233_g7910 [Leucocoprinus birnbaumii]
MDDSLNALSNVLSSIAEQPHNVALHVQHIQLAQSDPALDSELRSAMEMMTEFLAADPEHVWLPLIEQTHNIVDLDTASGVKELLSLYERAEKDYLSIPLLQKHLQLVVERYEKYHGDDKEMKPADLGDMFSEEWTREQMSSIVLRGQSHLTQSCLLWDVQRDWELERLAETAKAEKGSAIEYVEHFLLDRLQQPHSNNEETFQTYSSFTTNYKPPSEYENLLISASKSRSQATRSWERREALESALRQSPSLQAYGTYIAAEWRAKRIDFFTASGIYERAITFAASRRFKGDQGAEEALRSFWTGYMDAATSAEEGLDVELQIVQRAARSVPAFGEIWARYMRVVERMDEALEGVEEQEEQEGKETAHDVFTRALETKVIQQDVEQLIPVVLARASYERRRVESGKADEGGLATLISILESGIEMACQVVKYGDTRLRLEKALVDVYERLVDMPDAAIAILRKATNRQKTSYSTLIAYTDCLIKHEQYEEARKFFNEIHLKQIDWPEAIWEAWLTFEQLHGSVTDISICSEAEKAGYQIQLQAQAVDVIQDATGPASASTNAVAAAASMEVDAQSQDAQVERRGTKRAVEEEFPAPDSNKKVKTEPQPQPLKRDRENSTVFVADLPSDVIEEDLTKLFSDCGNVREVKITPLPDALVATVEFHERESVPAALTKDKKRINGQEIAVHLAWRSTLYATNFPESADDPFMRNLFGKYGTIFEIRWPSKKFKATRRFCYIQFTYPAAAEAALEVHQRELEPGLPVSVYISNPERKKERTDHDANEREIYVAGLSKFTTRADLQKVFQTYGKVKDIRLAEADDGHAKGYAFVEYDNPNDARAALGANNHELKKRRIAVTLSDPRVRARHKTIAETGLTRSAEIRQRSVRIRGLPPNTQEGLLQQALEKIALIKRVELFEDKHEAVVELETAAEAGKLLLRTEPLVFNDHTLQLSEEGGQVKSAPPPKAGGMFVPRKAGASRPKAGLGFTRAKGKNESSAGAAGVSGSAGGAKGQNDFRTCFGLPKLVESDCSESCSLTFEWTIRNLKHLFDTSKGDAKSKAVKSPKFGGGRWQILFYANGGVPKELPQLAESGGYISLFLACEPTATEREAALRNSGKWVRDGIYKFCFELRKQVVCINSHWRSELTSCPSVEKNILHNLKEASNHSFSYKTANWGWAQFARRDAVYYQSISAKTQDAFTIVCTITSSPSSTSLLPPSLNLSVPKPLIDTVGSLLDDPRYSDVEFVILRRNESPRKARRIWASRKMLQRAEHFEDMLGSNFAEGAMDYNPLQTPRPTTQAIGNSIAQSEAGAYNEDYLDSDDEDDDYFEGDDHEDIASQADSSDTEFAHVNAPHGDELSESIVQQDSRQVDDPMIGSQVDPLSTSLLLASIVIPDPAPTNGPDNQPATAKSHSTVLIRGVAYNTYRALLYYLYTDNIVFAPLSSCFVTSRLVMTSPSLPSSPRSEDTPPPPPSSRKTTYTDSATSRKEWIRDWMKHNPGRPAPCSAKAIYREADRLDLSDLKARAAHHIFKALTVENIAYEVFSPFASTFEEIRKVEIDFFLKNWQEIRTSDAMKSVWHQIRIGRHPGFEEAIAMNLEFKPDTPVTPTVVKNEVPSQTARD